MYKNLINKHLSGNLINEDKPNGLATTEKVQKTEKKVNGEYYSDVNKKMKDYDKAAKQEDKDAIVPVKRELSSEEKEYHDEMEILNGQEMLKYDNEPTKNFKERAEMSLKGDSKMGNKTYTGKDNGNTEEVWGSSGGKHTGEEILKAVKASTKKRNDAEYKLIQFGDDIENSGNEKTRGKARKVAVENKANNNKQLNETKMKKRLRFKKPFDGVGNALRLIPETYRVDLKEFEMTDGNETYNIRWEGSATEGRAIVESACDANMVNEDIQKMKHLMGYKSKDTLGLLKGDERLTENATFRQIMDKTKSLLTESEEEAELTEVEETEGEEVMESLIDEGWRDFLGMEKGDVVQQREQEFLAIIDKAIEKGMKVDKESLIRQGTANKFRGKLMPIKGMLIYKAGASGLGKMAAGSSSGTVGA